ncbi:gram-negative porin family protein, partial [Vibrio parahaemolyticus V-223/04]
DLPSKLW